MRRLHRDLGYQGRLGVVHREPRACRLGPVSISRDMLVRTVEG